MIRLVDSEPRVLSVDDARGEALAAYRAAQAAQRNLASRMRLLELLHRPTSVTLGRLHSELHEARAQVQRAQAVADALASAVEAIEAGARGGDSA